MAYVLQSTQLRALQVCGGSGNINQYPDERFQCDDRLLWLRDGTKQIRQLIIGREYARRG